MIPLKPIEWFKKCAPRSGLAQSLVWPVTILGLFISIVTGATTGYFNYKKEISSLEQSLTAIKQSQFPAIIENVCSKNTALLFKQAHAIKNIPHIVHVTINDGQNELAFAGEIAGRQLISRQYPITCFYDKAIRQTGMLTVTASADGITAAVMKSFFRTLIRDACSTLLLALAIILLVNHFFKRHINTIISFIQSLAPQQIDASCVLHRRHSTTPDELDTLVDSINGLLFKLLSGSAQLHEKELELSNAESSFIQVLNAVPLSIFWKDTNSVYRGCNQHFARLVGLDIPGRIVGKKDFMLPFFADTAEKLQALSRVVIKNKQAQHSIQQRGITSASLMYLDITLLPHIDEAGLCDGVIGLITDITELKKSHEQLVMLSAVVEQIHEIIVITDKQAVIQYVNPAFTKATGYSRAQAVGHTPALLRSGKQDENFYKTLWSTISQGEIWRGRFVNKKQNGELYNEEAAISPLYSASGEIINYLAVKRDITHDLKIEQQLRQVQKIEAIGTLAGGIAHDFNNILGVIYGYAEMSMDPAETIPQINSNLQLLISAANRAKDLIRQILTISRQTEKEALPITISPIVKEVIKFIRASLPSTIHIKQSLSATNDLLLADPIQIHQLLMNLCTNAGHAMKDCSGVLEINLKNVHFTDTDILDHPLIRSGDYICLSVKDTGCGIPGGNMEHIFEPYFTTKKSSEGTGLGLAVVQGIVSKCGGDIRVYSEVGKGTVFNVYLPVITSETERINTPVLEIPRGSEHILFVDDEISLVKTSKIILERLGYSVTGITNPEEALAVFKNTPDAFDLLITDKTMPELTGFDLVREIKAQRPDLPMILCTGVSVKADIEKVQEMGINGFLLKPFNKSELACIIRDVLDKKHVPKWAMNT